MHASGLGTAFKIRRPRSAAGSFAKVEVAQPRSADSQAPETVGRSLLFDSKSAIFRQFRVRHSPENFGLVFPQIYTDALLRRYLRAAWRCAQARHAIACCNGRVAGR